jgi:hypothetical protein
VIRYVPEDERTLELCWEAVNAVGTMLEFVPMRLRTFSMCCRAVSNTVSAFAFVPDEIALREEFVEFLQQCFRRGARVSMIEVERDYWRKRGNIRWDILRYIPEAERTLEICLECLADDGLALQYVPDGLITEGMCWRAVQCTMDQAPFGFVPKRFLSRSLILIVRENVSLELEIGHG